VAREITKISPKLLILGAWVPYYAPLIEHIKKNSRTKIALSWHSNFSQMELSLDHEMDMFLGVSSLLKAGKIDYLFMSDEEDSALLKHTINPNIFWLPDFLDMDFTKQASKLPMSSDAFKVSLFAFPTSRKNLLAQVAAVRAVNKAILYTNDLVRPRQRQNINYAQFFNSINVNHVNCGWMTKEKYYSTMVSMDVGLQVSFAETFSIVTAEHMALGVPCLVSSMVPVLKNNPALTENLLIRNANSAKEMAHKLSILRDNPDLRNNLGNICKEHIMGLNDRHKTAAVSMIGTLLASI
jgi:glycosyltransferase involved in cell wall biosynthesis